MPTYFQVPLTKLVGMYLDSIPNARCQFWRALRQAALPRLVDVAAGGDEPGVPRAPSNRWTRQRWRLRAMATTPRWGQALLLNLEGMEQPRRAGVGMCF